MRSIVSFFTTGPLRDLFYRQPGNVPALDALRTLAVTLVIVFHFSMTFLEAGGPSNWFGRLPIVTGGRYGVDLFFVLSGYLIGGQLWREVMSRGTVDVTQFMLRRSFRIWPLYFAFFAFVTFIVNRGKPFSQGWSDLLFITNYVDQGVVEGGWTLCVEEQFYIFAPLLILLGSKIHFPLRHYGKLLIGLLVLLPIVRAVVWWHLTGDMTQRNFRVFADSIYMPFHTHSDGLVVGMLIAYYRAFRPLKADTGRVSSGLCVFAAIMIFGAGFVIQREVFAFTGISLIFAAIVQTVLSHRIKWLDVLVFHIISLLSYGMYLNHQYMRDGIADFTMLNLSFLDGAPSIKEMAGASLLLLASAAVSLCTYCIIEYPFLHLRSRVLRRPQKSPSLNNELCNNPATAS